MYDFVDEILGNIFEIELYIIEKPFDADNVSFVVTGKLKLFEVSISKNAKAKESGIPIISETEFTAMFGDPSEFDLEQSEFWESFAELFECYEDFDETIKVLYAYSNWIKKGDLDRTVRTILSIAGEHDEDVQEELVELVKQLEASKKISTKVENFREGNTKGNGRYIYYSTGVYDANGNYALKAYDTKNNKAITVAKDGRYLTQYDGKLYYTRDIWDEAAGLTYTQIYEAKTSGKEAALIADLGPIGGSYKLKVKDGTVYYYHEIMDGANTVYNTYMFNLKDKTEDMAMGRETYNAVPELYVNLY